MKVPAQRTVGRVERATRAELRSLSVSVQTDATAALAVALSEQIDRARGAVAAAAAAGQLRALMGDLRRAAAEVKPTKDGIDELRARRARQQAAADAG